MGNSREEEPMDSRRPEREEQGKSEADGELIRRILQGERATQEAFVDRFSGLIYALLTRMDLGYQERDDLFQDVFLHLWKQNCRCLRQWQPGKGQLCSFLAVVVAHLVCDYKRRRTLVPGSTLDEQSLDSRQASDRTEADLTEQVYARQQQEAIGRSVRSLRPRDAELIRRRHFAQQSCQEIAQALQMPVAHVYVALARAEKRLCKQAHATYPGLFE